MDLSWSAQWLGGFWKVFVIGVSDTEECCRRLEGTREVRIMDFFVDFLLMRIRAEHFLKNVILVHRPYGQQRARPQCDQ